MALKNFFKKKEVVEVKSVEPIIENVVEVNIERPVKKVVTDKSTKKVKTSSMNTLTSKCFTGIEKEVAPDFHDEAKEIIRLTTDETRNEFLKYYQEDKGNICCMVLDKAKQVLVKEGKLKQEDDDAFGKPFML